MGNYHVEEANLITYLLRYEEVFGRGTKLTPEALAHSLLLSLGFSP